MIHEKTIEEIFAEIKVSEREHEHEYGFLELSHFPTELLSRIKKVFSKIDSLEPFEDLTDNDGVFLGKDGYERLGKVIHHLNEIEKIISPPVVEEIVESNESGLNIYKISHYYSLDDKKYSAFVETNIGLESFIKTIAAINFKFEELVDETECIDHGHLAIILEKFFDVRDKTHKYRKHASATCMNKGEWELSKTFKVTEGEKELLITQIDLHRVRECNNGKDYEKLMKDYLPNSIEFESEVKNLRDFYPWRTNK